MKPKSQSIKLIESKKKDKAEYLTETSAGMYLSANHAKMIWQGNKTLIVLGVNYRGTVGSRFYIIGGNDCYGVIKISSIQPIDLAAFRELSSRHRLTEKERKERWPNKKVLYAYFFDIVKKFDIPKRVAVLDGNRTFMEKVSFLSSEEKCLEDGIYEYKPENRSTVALESDFKTIIKWLAGCYGNQESKYTSEELESILQSVMEELQKRKAEPDPEKLNISERKLFEKIRLRMNAGIPVKKLAEIAILKLSSQFSEVTLVKDFVSLAGHSAKNPESKDLDLIVRFKDSGGYLRKVVEARLCEAGIRNKNLHFFCEEDGIYDSHVPVYDLVLRKTEPRFIKTKEEVTPMSPFRPMREAKEYSSTDELINYLFGGI